MRPGAGLRECIWRARVHPMGDAGDIGRHCSILTRRAISVAPAATNATKPCSCAHHAGRVWGTL
eukprot:scaffold123308_cov51-Phaeocystis_antarctica.AAC.1